MALLIIEQTKLVITKILITFHTKILRPQHLYIRPQLIDKIRHGPN